VDESLLRIFIECTPGAGAMLDRDLRYLAVSGGWGARYGRDAKEVIGKSLSEVHPDIPPRWSELHQRCLAGETLGEEQDPWVRKDGTTEYVRWSLQPWRDAQGEIGGLFAFSEVVTARVQLERALRDSERRFRTLAESTSDVVWSTGPDGQELTDGKSWTDFAGKRGWGAVHPEDVEQARAAWEEAVAGRRSYEAEYRLRRPDGTWVPVLARGTPVQGADGAVREWVGTIVDISARKRADAHLHFLAKASVLLERSLDPEQTAAAIVALSVPDFADACSLELRTESGSEQVAIAHRDPERAALMREFRRLYPPDPQSPWGTPAVLRSGKSELIAAISDAELDASAPDARSARMLKQIGLRSLIMVPLVAVGERLGAMVFALSTGQRRFDESDLRVAEEMGRRAAIALQTARLFRDAESARKDAEAASRAKDEFLAMLGHELRNPLAPIVTALQLLKLRGELKPGRGQAILERQVKHLIRLVDDLLDISRVTRGMVELRKEDLELHAVVARAVEMASPLLEQKRHAFTALVPRTGLLLHGDETRLAQAIGNLLTNAARYTPAGGSVSLEAAREGDELVVRVRDNGNGIRKELLPRVFELFVQGDRSIERAEGGLGIGLTLVRTFVAMHGGSVTASSAGVGEGSEFVVRLPALPALPAPAEPAPQAGPPARAARARRVLVVDDNEDAADMLAEALQAEGHVVQVAHDAAEALSMAFAFGPEIAVLDLGLPVMDGYELAARIRSDGRALRLIAVTGYGQETDRERSRAAGFERHLVKPIELSELLAALE
jgi:PAS domain S-box-containing protein